MATRNQHQNPRTDIEATQRWVRQCDDRTLLEGLHALLADERRAEVKLLSFMGEVDHRKLYRQRAFSSMFQFVVGELHLSESRAYKRITAARAARKYPALLERIARGELHLSAVCMLAPYLTPENHETLATQATHKSKRTLEKLLARMFPKPDVPPRVRKLPSPDLTNPCSTSPLPENPPNVLHDTTAAAPCQEGDSKGTSGAGTSQADNGSERVVVGPEASVSPAQLFPTQLPAAQLPAAQLPPGAVEPLSASRYKVTFTAEQELVGKLKQAQELLGPGRGKRNLAAVIDQALDLLVSDLLNKKHGVTSRPRQSEPRERAEKSEPTKKKRSRSIPRSVRRAVYERDQGQCAYRSTDGRRCSERSGLEYHHRVPFARGGEHSVANIELRCKCHNALAAEEDFGATYVASRVGHLVREARVEYRVGEGVSHSEPSGHPSSATQRREHRGRSELGRPDPPTLPKNRALLASSDPEAQNPTSHFPNTGSPRRLCTDSRLAIIPLSQDRIATRAVAI